MNQTVNKKEARADNADNVHEFPSGPEKAGVLGDVSDRALVEMVCKGDKLSFEEMVRRYARKFYAFAFRYTVSREEAEEVVQVSFTKFWQQPVLCDLTHGTSFTTWFYGVVLRECREILCQQKELYPVYDEDMPVTMPDLNAQQDVLTCLKSLPERQREAFILSFYEEVTHKEAGIVIDEIPESIALLIGQAKQALRDVTKKEEKEFEQALMKVVLPPPPREFELGVFLASFAQEQEAVSFFMWKRNIRFWSVMLFVTLLVAGVVAFTFKDIVSSF